MKRKSQQKEQQDINYNQPDVTKRPIALWLPFVITGVFGLIGIYYTWWLNKPTTPHASPEVMCETKIKLNSAIEKISSANLSIIDLDDKLFLLAAKEKFESDILNPDICTDLNKANIITQEIGIVNKILFNE